MPDPRDTRDLESFAMALADELPGRWRSEYHRHTVYDDQFSLAEDVWDMNLVSAAVAQYVLEHDAVLTRDDGARLYVIGRPRQDEEYLVAAMAPADVVPEAFRGVREPDGIVVPDDPFRAADDITAHLLPRYDKAFAQVQHNAQSLAPQAAVPSDGADRVEMTWADDGGLVARPASEDAAAVLRDSGFVYDERQQTYVLSGDDTAAQGRSARAAGARLSALGIGAVIRNAPSKPALDTTTRAAPTPAKPARTR
ncbi:hypothetical protein [Streptomyces sp. AK02-01A]|uniref:hypothetical protein n=1 Tax=Streptomyces sp. AK02-01A TaxID=3028648 RepID=UPI0029AB90F0|nr:hypothetical protein [Streptomyces sp. AK02-01A]MDX3855660.1 hypothetical protein [Streptomyces sp. AK02-01A]